MRLLIVALLLWAHALPAQNNSGELRLKITDSAGLGLKSVVELTSSANQIHSMYATEPSGTLAIHALPLGTYNLRVSSPGFLPWVEAIEVRSSIPRELSAALAIAPPNTTVTVTDNDTVLDPHQVGTVERIGRETIAYHDTSQPGRALQDLVNEEPGWLYEGNAVLHPRGSEYQTQLVIDGVPILDNRSPGLGPAMGVQDIESMSIYTAGFPAEYGRKLGGVIEIDTTHDSSPGLRGTLQFSGGSFATSEGYADVQYGWGSNTLSLRADGGVTDWYLNPPVIENYTNRGTIGDFGLHYERDLTPADRIRVSVQHAQSEFQVPNEQVQQLAGQRQNRSNGETGGSLMYQHVVSADLLGDLRVMARSLDADLNSNAASTPIIAAQQRTLNEQYVKGTVSYHHGRNEAKAGVEADFATIGESFSDQITDLSQFAPGTPPSFRFRASAPDREQAAFLQDTIQLGNWTVSLGVRLDHYRVLVESTAASPRIGVARYFQSIGAVFHATYDRVFQTPATENLLISSSPAIAALNPEVLRLPVRPSFANYFELGVSKEFGHAMRTDLNYFRRIANNFTDDDQLLNTSVSFPIAFRRASIYGAEAKIDLPVWHRFSGTGSYSYLVGTAYLPVTGGLFLGADAVSALQRISGRFPISQDQRNTIRLQGRYQLHPRVSISMSGDYGSGLPVQFSGSVAEALAQYGASIVDRVDFSRGRVRPNLSINVEGTADLWKHERKTLRLQMQGENLNNRLNLIDFAGVFSGNALAPPRSYQTRLSYSF